MIKYTVIVLSICFWINIFTSCSKKEVSDENVKSTFVISDTMMKEIRLDTVKRETVNSQLLLTGKVYPDENKIINVYPLVGGSVKEVYVELGDYVTKGEVLAVIQSGEIADYERQLIDAQSDLLVAQKQQAVTQDLYDGKLTSEKDLISAKKEAEKAQANLNRMNEIFKIYSIGKQSSYVVKAPISGFVVDKNINREMQIRSDNTDRIFTISQLDELWVIADVFESDISKIKLGYEAVVNTISYPDKKFKGKIDKVYNVLDARTKTMKIRIKLNNSELLLKPEMHATVRLFYSDGIESELVPAKAVIFDKSKNYVMVYKDKYNVETREVEVLKTLDKVTYLTKGVKAGEVIISQNQLLIYDALND
ncbi:MAG: efflux RND transporter periplasmic adaptor subunit [Cytophagaceae bacterium]|nr:efflux RND transporter periplasmic adaptor subunit [Cytophagaceae bacterium]